MKVVSIATVACAIACGSCSPHRVQVRCERGDFTHDQKNGEGTAAREWLEDAYSCRIGEYNLLVPVDRDSNAIELTRAGRSLLFRSDRESILLGSAPDLSVLLSDRNHDGHLDSITYDTWKGKVHYVSAQDWNLDGQPDVRMWDTADGSMIHEAWVGDAWRRIFLRGGFRLVDDPRKRLRKDDDGNFSVVDESAPVQEGAAGENR